MAQALEKMNVSKTFQKNGFFLQKMVILFQHSVFGEIQFTQKSLTHREKQSRTLQQILVSRNPNNITLLLQAPARRNQNSENGARGDRDSPDQNESPIPDLSNARPE